MYNIKEQMPHASDLFHAFSQLIQLCPLHSNKYPITLKTHSADYETALAMLATICLYGSESEAMASGDRSY